MYAIRLHTLWLAMVAVLLAGGFVATTAESAESGHQQEAHHCMTCCTTSHAAAPATQIGALPLVVSSASRLPITALRVHTSAVVRLPDPPPKLLA